MKFALFSLVMNIPNAVTGETLTTQQKFQNLLARVDGLTEAEQREQVAHFAEEVAPVVRRALPRTAWSSSALPHANRPLMRAAASALPAVVQP